MKTHPNIPDPDGFYEALIAAQDGLSDAQCEALLLRWVLLLANQLGDQQLLLDTLAAARAMVSDEKR